MVNLSAVAKKRGGIYVDGKLTLKILAKDFLPLLFDITEHLSLIYYIITFVKPVKSQKLRFFWHSCEGGNPVNSNAFGCQSLHRGLDPGPA